MPIDVTKAKPRERVVVDKRDLLAAERGLDRAAIEAHLSAALAAENATKIDPAAPDLTPAEVIAVLDPMSDANLRGLINHLNEITTDLDLRGWRAAWPTMLGGMPDELASAMIRFAERLAAVPLVAAGATGRTRAGTTEGEAR